MNYVGQGAELTIELPPDAVGVEPRRALARTFADAYRRTFGQAPRDVPVQILHLRLRAQGPAETAGLRVRAAADGDGRKGERAVYFPDVGFAPTPVYDRAALPTDVVLAGPAIVEEAESTLVVGPGARFRRDGLGNVVVDLPSAEMPS
jgi:N-methylhydantoinase A